MRVFCALAAMILGLMMLAGRAQASADIQVDLSTQTMTVTSSSGESYVWPVSTARRGYVTPRGTYGVQSLQAMHYSHKYHNSPMPHSIFFRGGYAIHGTYAVGALGRAASHGCIRLSPANAATLYAMVQHEGGRITVTGSGPNPTRTAALEGRHHHHRATAVASRHVPAAPLSYAPMAPSFDDWLQAPGAGGN